MKSSSYKKAFTLIELLVSIAIIGALISISMVSFSNVRQKSRDTKRISDIKLIQKSLEDYYRNEGSYPATLIPGQNMVGSSSNVVYMQIPENPKPRNDGDCPDGDYSYQTTDNGNSYKLDFCLSETTAQINAGEKCANPQGILNKNCFSCGDQIKITNIAGHTCNPNPPYYDTCVYDTVYIDKNGGHDMSLEGQCWMKQNLNIGTIVDGSTEQNKNNILEKYCYDNDFNNCTNYGGLYQWDETMQYSVSERAQGICPTGWHIPSDTEYNDLDQSLTDTGQSCDANRNTWDCANAGLKLKITTIGLWSGTNSSGFTALPAGYGLNNYFGQKEVDADFWSSTTNESTVWYRTLARSVNSDIKRAALARSYAFSIRCLKN